MAHAASGGGRDQVEGLTGRADLSAPFLVYSVFRRPYMWKQILGHPRHLGKCGDLSYEQILEWNPCQTQ